MQGYCIKNIYYKYNKKNKENVQNIDFPSPNTSQGRKTCQDGYCKRNRSNNTCRKCKKIVCGKYVNKIEYMCKNTRNKCNV